MIRTDCDRRTTIEVVETLINHKVSSRRVGLQRSVVY